MNQLEITSTLNGNNPVKTIARNDSTAVQLTIREAPIFHPTTEEFKDPMAYFNKIYLEAEKYGICKIVPPDNWSPPFSITPEELRFQPRVQILHLLEAKQRMKVTFYKKINSFWSMFGVKIKLPITVNSHRIDLSELYYFSIGEIEAKQGNVKPIPIPIEAWLRIATNMKLDSANMNLSDSELALELNTLYKTLIKPMNEFNKFVTTQLQRGEKLNDKECKGTPKKRRMMAGSARRAVKKTMKATMASMPVLQKMDPVTQAQILEKMTTALVVEDVCEKCRLNTKMEQDNKACITCKRFFHKKCLDPCPIKSQLISEDFNVFKCKSCVATSLHKDPLLNFAFHDSTVTYDLSNFEDFANQFKQDHFNSNDVNERTVENEFWKNVMDPTSNLKVLYGADLQYKTFSGEHGSGFPSANRKRKHSEIEDDFSEDLHKYEESGWNLNNFPHLKSSLLRHIGDNVSGMTRPWIYVGMCFAAFCWHTEDHWTPSINYLHLGEPKTWYGVPGSYAENFDTQMKKYVPTLFKLQPDVLHLLNTLIHPNELLAAGIPVCRTDQRAGEFVITLPRAYHSGFNQGFNCAEAVNFATDKWLKMGFNSIEHYATIKRNNVFSHEELLCKLAESASTLELEAAEEAFVQFNMILSSERELYSDLTLLGIKSRKCVRLEDLENDDERSCFYCSKTLFFSAFGCPCRASMAPKMRQSCGTHFKLLCRCAITKRQFMYRYTIRELENYARAIYERIQELNSTKLISLQ